MIRFILLLKLCNHLFTKSNVTGLARNEFNKPMKNINFLSHNRVDELITLKNVKSSLGK